VNKGRHSEVEETPGVIINASLLPPTKKQNKSVSRPLGGSWIDPTTPALAPFRSEEEETSIIGREGGPGDILTTTLKSYSEDDVVEPPPTRGPGQGRRIIRRAVPRLRKKPDARGANIDLGRPEAGARDDTKCIIDDVSLFSGGPIAGEVLCEGLRMELWTLPKRCEQSHHDSTHLQITKKLHVPEPT